MTAAIDIHVRAERPDPASLERLRAHLLHDHHRAGHELSGLPLDAVHELEHFDATFGLLLLDHTHTT